MGLQLMQLERMKFSPIFNGKNPSMGNRSKIRKWYRNQRSRKIRRTPIDKEPPHKFTGGWEW